MAAIDTDLPSLTLVKTMTYRGAPEEWSNTYFFTGAMPTSDASWKALADNVIAQEKLALRPNQSIIRAVGHQAGESVAVWEYDYAAHSASVAGTFSVATGSALCPGDTAAWVRWSTSQKTSKGKPIFLRSYFHGCLGKNSSTDDDSLEPTYKTALQTYGDAWVTGFADADAVTHKRAGPHGAVGLVALAATYLTTRTLERRGRRPT